MARADDGNDGNDGNGRMVALEQLVVERLVMLSARLDAAEGEVARLLSQLRRARGAAEAQVARGEAREERLGGVLDMFARVLLALATAHPNLGYSADDLDSLVHWGRMREDGT